MIYTDGALRAIYILFPAKLFFLSDSKRRILPNAYGGIAGVKNLFYGKDALLVRCESWIYNVAKEPRIYYKAH